MSKQNNWTPEPWHFRTREMDGIGCYSNDIRIYQGTRENGLSEWVADCGCETDPIRHKNARRIVACVNACTGLADPAAEIKAMREVCEAARAFMLPPSLQVSIVDNRDRLRLAIHNLAALKAEGEATNGKA